MGRIVVGIDISKKKFDVALYLPNEKWLQREFDNSPVGFMALQKWFVQNKVTKVHAAMEATGRYGEDLAHDLHGNGHTVSVLNPAQIKYYGKSKLSRAKTDRKDARLIGEFSLLHKNLSIWHPKSVSSQKLKDLFRCLESLKGDHTKHVNRLESAKDPCVRDIYETQREQIKKQIKELQKAIRLHVQSCPDLKEQTYWMVSIIGIGETTAWGFLAETPDLKNFKNAKQLAAYAGLNPAVVQSGSSVRGRGGICKIGSANLRKLLYLPAMVATRCNPVIKVFADRLKGKGKNGKVVIVASMRKLLHIIFGVLTKGEVFEA